MRPGDDSGEFWSRQRDRKRSDATVVWRERSTRVGLRRAVALALSVVAGLVTLSVMGSLLMNTSAGHRAGSETGATSIFVPAAFLCLSCVAAGLVAAAVYTVCTRPTR
jgi:hypothetical protein